MNDDEKAFEAFRMTDRLCQCYEEWRSEIEARFRKGTRFPYFQRGRMKDDKGNDWTFLFFCLSKEMRKRRIYRGLAYITYEIPPRRIKNDLNAGKGCLLMDPIAMQNRIRGIDTRGSIIYDIIPHAFNRYTERYLKPLGRDKISFGYKVEDMLTRWQWFDVSADLEGDKNAEKHKGDNIAPFDVMMRGGGMLRGQIVHELMLRISTYVSEDMMFENQLQRQQEMVGEYHRLKGSLYDEAKAARKKLQGAVNAKR